MRVRSIHPIVSHTSGVLKFAPVGPGVYEADLPDDVAKALIGLSISLKDNQFSRPPDGEEPHGATPASEEHPGAEVELNPDTVEAEGELVDDPADEASAQVPSGARRGRRGGSRAV